MYNVTMLASKLDNYRNAQQKVIDAGLYVRGSKCIQKFIDLHKEEIISRNNILKHIIEDEKHFGPNILYISEKEPRIIRTLQFYRNPSFVKQEHRSSEHPIDTESVNLFKKLSDMYYEKYGNSYSKRESTINSGRFSYDYILTVPKNFLSKIYRLLF
ncbi:hypothetical protein J6G99_08875 [bacterium]|nr:hypothetical protein [bacterium]